MDSKELALKIHVALSWNNITDIKELFVFEDGTIWKKVEWIVCNQWWNNLNSQYIEIITNEVITSLKNAIKNFSNLSWNDIEKLWDYLKEKARLIKLYTPKDNDTLSLDLINFYANKTKSIDYSNNNFNELTINELLLLINKLRFETMSIIDCISEQWELLRWEQMEYFWRELLNMWSKISIANYFIEYKKESNT